MQAINRFIAPLVLVAYSLANPGPQITYFLEKEPATTIEDRRIVRFGCPETLKINKSKDPWNAKDDENLEISKKKDRCSAHWPGNPCLVRFFKTDVQTYYAECGKKRRL